MGYTVDHMVREQLDAFFVLKVLSGFGKLTKQFYLKTKYDSRYITYKIIKDLCSNFEVM